jgi:two-component system sensor histidine kinase YesM
MDAGNVPEAEGVKWLIRKFRKLKLRTRLIWTYIVLISVPATVIGLQYYSKSTEIILENAGSHVHEIVRKNNEIIGSKISKIQESSLSLLIDPDLFQILSRPKPRDESEWLLMDKQITPILNRYFLQNKDIYSAHLITPDYSFGSNFFSIPNRRFRETALYRAAVEGQGSLLWIPTYDMQEQLQVSPRTGERYVFSAVRQVNAMVVQDGSPRKLPPGTDSPVLLLNLTPEFFASVLQDSITLPNAYLFVVAPDGRIVYHPDAAMEATREREPWLAAAIAGGSGTIAATMHGKKVLIGYDRIREMGWITAAVVPYDSLLSKLQVFRIYTLTLLLVVTILGIGIAFLLSGWLTGPIQKLLAAIQMNAIGNFNSQMPEPNDYEFSYLTRKFNDMNEKIRQLIHENYEAKLRENESRLREKEAELAALSMQLDPHFLYNTLNTINWLAIEKQQPEISRLLVGLSKMLQFTVHNKQELIRLRDELEWLHHYLLIMRARFANRFEVVFDIDPRLYGMQVPKFFLQPLIENSLIHGFEHLESGGRITIRGIDAGNEAAFFIEDNGCGIARERLARLWDDPEHVGLANVRKRIALIYGDGYEMEVESEEGCGTRIRLNLPLAI